MLQSLLQEYLIENGSLPLPECGLLTIDHEPAYLQKVDKSFVVPTSDILFIPLEIPETEINNLVLFLSKQLNISYEQAKELVNRENITDAFVKKMGPLIKWPDSDINCHKNGQQTNIENSFFFNNYFPPFSIEKIHRQPVTVAETTTQPGEIISEEAYPEYEEPVVKDYWWVWALVIFFLSVLLILFWFV